MRKLLIIVLLLLAVIQGSLFGLAELNYLVAIHSASRTDGTDMTIELAMSEYGFQVDAMSAQEPTQLDKLEALFN